ncbi:rod shape-determining protein MreC [Bacillus taeanensis]|uniref:Cell shape-determining protein MreC n=1 Tax=Bacillus taeanensis TaxID=273032 RepID=A0A366Y2I8_9BACI|nr:rod shape-determining protein MreC [Bacillus taeanensis]RBW71595.1 rod shape-determining protein MreC [Bacillus taeanensis]
MPRFFSNKRLIVLLVSIIILVAMIGFSMKERKSLSTPEQFLKDSVGWVQSIFYKPAQAAAGFFENIQEMKNLYEQNQVLKARLDEYAKLAYDVKELKEDNESLKALIDKKESLQDYNVFPASIIARSPDRWNKLITIDKGQKDGIDQNMAVITPEGLIGKVLHAQEFSSTVQLISALDRTNRISAVVEDNEEIFGIIEGFNSEKQMLIFNATADIEIKEGAAIVTSGLGGVFPKGLIIGEVVEVKNDDYGLTKSAYVKPAANLYNIDHVMVVERKSQIVTENDELEMGG